MTTLALARDAEQFAKSSSYRCGDATSFSIRLHGSVSLPGKCSPDAYLTSIGLETVPERVLVVCPGNGGLAAECYMRGAKKVTLLEPRDRFHNPLRRVLSLLAQGWREEDRKGLNHRLEEEWPLTEQAQKSIGQYDLIIWSEGVEDISEPRVLFESLRTLLTDTGKLFVEVVHGRHEFVERINSWQPKPTAFAEMAKQVFGQAPTSAVAGRRAGRMIYTLEQATVTPIKPAPAPAKKTKAAKSVPSGKVSAPMTAPAASVVDNVEQEVPPLAADPAPQAPEEPKPADTTPVDTTPGAPESVEVPKPAELDVAAAVESVVAEDVKRKKTKRDKKSL